jgi:hypothetical protein
MLTQRPARAWLNQHADPADTVLYLGIDCSEVHRTPAIVNGWAPWTARLPMWEPPHLSKQDMFDAARVAGLTPPRLYEFGFSHINSFWTMGDWLTSFQADGKWGPPLTWSEHHNRGRSIVSGQLGIPRGQHLLLLLAGEAEWRGAGRGLDLTA